LSLLDCLSAGFRTIARRWWLILIPVLLDVFLWIGPRVGISRVMEQMSEVLASQETALIAGESQAALVQQTQQILDQLGQDANLLALLSAGIPGVPSLLTAFTPSAQPLGSTRLVIQVQDVSQVILWSLLCLFLGTILSSIYITAVGRAVRREFLDADASPLPTHAFHTWTRVLLIGLIVAGIGLLLSIPLILIFALAMLISPALAIVLVNLALIAVLWIAIGVLIYLYFIVDAIVIHHLALLPAMWNSINIVVRNLWPSAGLILLTWLLNNGLMLIWTRLGTSVWTTAVGIVANAFIGTGLAAASFTFYVQRYRRWQEAPEAASSPLLRLWRGPKT